MQKRLLKLLGVSSFLLILTSCSGKDINSSGPHEFSSGPVIDSSEPTEKLLKKANDYYDDENYNSAIKVYETIYRRAPYGKYSLYVKTKIADGYFKNGNYEEAATNYYDIVKKQFGNYNKEYAIFMTGLSNYKSFKGIGRDTAVIKKAIEFFDVILQDYPNSRYTLDAKKYKLECYKILAQGEKEILNYYEKQGNMGAISTRKRDFERNWKKYLE